MGKKKNNKTKIYFWTGTILIFLFIPLYFLNQYLENPKSNVVPKPTPTIASKPTVPQIVATKIPTSADLVVPYTVQAPFGNWADHEDSCEAAAILMYHYYLSGSKTDIDPTVADLGLAALQDREAQLWGNVKNLTLERVGELAQDYYGYQFQVIPDLTEAQIEEEIVAGHPVLVPVLTQSLKNPYYSPGTVYHILLIKGYDATGVITNDAGIKEGKDWHYNWDILWSAIDAQTPTMGQGRIGLIITN